MTKNELKPLTVKRLSALGYSKVEINEKFHTDETFWLRQDIAEAYKIGKREYVNRVLSQAYKEGIINLEHDG